MAFVLAISAALAGAGYWALVIQQVTQVAVMLTIVVIAARWLPRRPRPGIAMDGILLAVAGVFQTLAYVGYWVYLSRGLTRDLFQYTLITSAIKGACILVGSLWGVLGVATGYAIAPAIAWPLSFWWMSRRSGIPVRGPLVSASVADSACWHRRCAGTCDQSQMSLAESWPAVAATLTTRHHDRGPCTGSAQSRLTHPSPDGTNQASPQPEAPRPTETTLRSDWHTRRTIKAAAITDPAP